MRRENWLLSYARVEGIERILERMAGRTRRRGLLRAGGGLLRRHYEGLGRDFRELWPGLLAASASSIGDGAT